MCSVIGNPKVVQLSKCDGSLSNQAIIAEGPQGGSLVQRMDGVTGNACPTLLASILNGTPAPAHFPHPACQNRPSSPFSSN